MMDCGHEHRRSTNHKSAEGSQGTPETQRAAGSRPRLLEMPSRPQFGRDPLPLTAKQPSAQSAPLTEG